MVDYTIRFQDSDALFEQATSTSCVLRSADEGKMI